MEQKQSNIRSITVDHDPQRDTKYVVLKRSELEVLLLELGCQSIGDEHAASEWARDCLESYALTDAVVIRTKDAFAGPALHSYAHNIALVASLTDNPMTKHQLQQIADYFADRAREADVQAYEDTTKLPD